MVNDEKINTLFPTLIKWHYPSVNGGANTSDITIVGQLQSVMRTPEIADFLAAATLITKFNNLF
jgi:hypothetical protein